jgi:hypothetical protein
MSPQLLGLLVIIMELASSAISFVIGYYAMKAYRVSSSKSLLLLYLGFVILGVGTFLRVITATYIIAVLRVVETPGGALLNLLNLAGSIYTVTQLIAYSLFTTTFILQARTTGQQAAMTVGSAAGAAVPVYRLFFIPGLELIAMAMLGFIVVQTLINWLLRKSGESALVFLGFSFMLLSHLLFLFMFVNETLLFLGQVTQLAGFACLLMMLAKVSRVHA